MWLRDVALIRTMLLNCVGNRMMEMKTEEKFPSDRKVDRRDILTFIMEDCQFENSERQWTDLELLEYVSRWFINVIVFC